MVRLLLLTCALVVVAGCSSSRPQSEIERGRRAVMAALDSWKTKDLPEKLKALEDPVEFSEELRSTHTLTDYSLGNVDATDKEVIRYSVSLNLKDRRGKTSTREAVYAVSLKSPVVVARDPYY